MDALGMTSRWVAAARERESGRADRLFNDPLAGALAGDEGRAMLAAMEAGAAAPAAGSPPDNPFLAIRTRFLDDRLMAAVGEGLRQVVILAAGMDARAFRLEWPPGTTIFEVERPEVLAYKEQVLLANGAAPKAARRAVAVDLRDDFAKALAQAGFDRSKPAAFLVEGLLVYLPDETAALNVLKEVAMLAAHGSMIALDISGASLLKSPFMKPLVDRLAARGAPWLFGTDAPEELIERAGFGEVQALDPGQVGHGRWPYPAAPRSMPGIPRNFLVTARKTT